MTTGTLSAVVLIYLSPTLQIDVLHHPAAPFPLRNPGIITLPLSFLTGAVASLLWPDPQAAERFAEVERRGLLGVVGE
jgi:cation/acetate symporter